MATSPGARGGASVLEIAKNSLPRYGANIVATFSLPGFYENFDVDKQQISNPLFDNQIKDIVKEFSF